LSCIIVIAVDAPAVAFATAVIVFIVSFVFAAPVPAAVDGDPSAANTAVAFYASAVAAVAAVIAAAVAAATTIGATAAVVDCYVFVTPSLDFNGASSRQRHP